MDINEFLKNFANELEMTPIEEISASTVYKDLEEWDSLLGLTIIGMVSNNYHVKITGEEVRNNKTIEDLFKLVSAKIKK